MLTGRSEMISSRLRSMVRTMVLCLGTEQGLERYSEGTSAQVLDANSMRCGKSRAGIHQNHHTHRERPCRDASVDTRRQRVRSGNQRIRGTTSNLPDLRNPRLGASMKERKRQITADPYDWPHDGSLDPTTTALVIIDMQRDCKCWIECLHLSAPLLQAVRKEDLSRR